MKMMSVDKFGEVMLMLFPGKDGETKTKPECPVSKDNISPKHSCCITFS